MQLGLLAPPASAAQTRLRGMDLVQFLVGACSILWPNPVPPVLPRVG